MDREEYLKELKAKRALIDCKGDASKASERVQMGDDEFVEVLGAEWIEDIKLLTKRQLELTLCKNAIAGDTRAAVELLAAQYPEQWDKQIRIKHWEDSKIIEGAQLPRLTHTVIPKADRCEEDDIPEAKTA